MKSTIITGLFAATVLTHPASVSKRFSIKTEDDTNVGNSDVTILTYALVLEHLENAFYRGGLANFTEADYAAAGFDSIFYNNLVEVAKDEANHVAFLTAGLTAAGANIPAECVYTFPYTDAAGFVALATVLEGVGVAAYLGAAADIASPDYLTAAGSILTIETRHNAYLRAQEGESPFPAPYDTPLDFNQVYSLASGFFVSCPSTNPTLDVHAFPKIVNMATGPVKSGDTVVLGTDGYVLTAPTGSISGLFGAFMTPTGPLFVPATAVTGGYSVVVPDGVNGQTYVVLTACGEKVNDETTAAGPAIIEVEN